MTKRRPSVSKKHQDKLLALLCDGLSEEELGGVMAGALLVMDEPARARLMKLLGSDIGATLQSILEAAQVDGPGTAKSEKRVGAGKILQEWKQAWREWDECVYESGREEGKYKYQEHHWEEPYLDTGTLADDIDRIAGRLRPLAARVTAEGLDPDFSLPDRMCQTIDDIGCGLPDHMDPWAGDGFSFGREATRMLLEWECAVSRKKTEPLSEAIRRVAELTMRTEKLSLDDQSIIAFVRHLSKTDREVVVGDLRAHQSSEPWKSALSRGWGTWFHVLKALGGTPKATKRGSRGPPVAKRR